MGVNNSISGAKIVWFGQGQAQDEQYLKLWRDVPLSYVPGQADATFHIDHHEDVIVPNADAQCFERATDLLLRYQFYPSSLMLHVSDFSWQYRRMQKGDRILQRIHGAKIFGWALFSGLTMNEIWQVMDEPRKAGFTYVTTEAHAEKGEWTAQIEWRADNALVLTIDVTSRLARDLPALMVGYIRRIQLNAHHLGIENFRALVTGDDKAHPN